jgi:starvation-inducible DNA-binding protein
MDYLGLNEEKTRKTVKTLNRLLANYQVYYQNLRNFHWNIVGENFFDLHDKFEELYVDAREKVDEIAERILVLRHRPMSQMSAYLKYAEVAEAEIGLDDHAMVDEILENHRILIQNMRMVLESSGDSGDEGTIDMIAGFLENLEKKSWMLDAWKQKTYEAVTV